MNLLEVIPRFHIFKYCSTSSFGSEKNVHPYKMHLSKQRQSFYQHYLGLLRVYDLDLYIKSFQRLFNIAAGFQSKALYINRITIIPNYFCCFIFFYSLYTYYFIQILVWVKKDWKIGICRHQFLYQTLFIRWTMLWQGNIPSSPKFIHYNSC